MRYISTRDPQTIFETQDVIAEKQATDRGVYLPSDKITFTPHEIVALKDTPFNQIVADILNLFFDTHLSAWDIELCLGKTPGKTVAVSHRIVISELWHNPKGSISFFENALLSKLTDQVRKITCNPWVRVAIKIAILFGLYGQLQSQEHFAAGSSFDFVVQTDDFTAPISAWYARSMGLPIHRIICTCNEESDFWEFVHRGAFNGANATDAAVTCIEALLYLTLGAEEVARFAYCMTDGSVYSLDEEQHPLFTEGIFCSVISAGRVQTTIRSTLRSTGYHAEPETALRLAALQDYRASAGSSLQALLIADKAPLGH